MSSSAGRATRPRIYMQIGRFVGDAHFLRLFERSGFHVIAYERGCVFKPTFVIGDYRVTLTGEIRLCHSWTYPTICTHTTLYMGRVTPDDEWETVYTMTVDYTKIVLHGPPTCLSLCKCNYADVTRIDECLPDRLPDHVRAVLGGKTNVSAVPGSEPSPEPRVIPVAVYARDDEEEEKRADEADEEDPLTK
jgi:hypothetical protein